MTTLWVRIENLSVWRSFRLSNCCMGQLMIPAPREMDNTLQASLMAQQRKSGKGHKDGGEGGGGGGATANADEWFRGRLPGTYQKAAYTGYCNLSWMKRVLESTSASHFSLQRDRGQKDNFYLGTPQCSPSALLLWQYKRLSPKTRNSSTEIPDHPDRLNRDLGLHKIENRDLKNWR